MAKRRRANDVPPPVSGQRRQKAPEQPGGLDIGAILGIESKDFGNMLIAAGVAVKAYQRLSARQQSAAQEQSQRMAQDMPPPIHSVDDEEDEDEDA